MGEEQLTKMIELIETQNEMIARIGLILVRMTWLLVTIIIVQIIAWIF